MIEFITNNAYWLGPMVVIALDAGLHKLPGPYKSRIKWFCTFILERINNGNKPGR